jgi:steroid 5-alpha reductase family enzyme
MNWDEFMHLAALNFGWIIGLMVLLWAVSVAVKDSSIVDMSWGMGLAISAWFTYFLSEGVEPRRILILVLVTVWGVRLSAYLVWRNWGKEDPRYRQFRKNVEEKGGNYTLHSLTHIYLMQGFAMWVTSLVLVFSIMVDTPKGLGVFACAGVALWTLGMFFEVVGDAQLARFRADPQNQGKIMDRGLWRYTRHPNYFGEACVWFGFLLVACDNPLGLGTVVSPAVMLYALTGPTGKGPLERRMRENRPDFEAYVRRTSGFFPLPPRRDHPRATGRSSPDSRASS